MSLDKPKKKERKKTPKKKPNSQPGRRHERCCSCTNGAHASADTQVQSKQSKTNKKTPAKSKITHAGNRASGLSRTVSSWSFLPASTRRTDAAPWRRAPCHSAPPGQTWKRERTSERLYTAWQLGSSAARVRIATGSNDHRCQPSSCLASPSADVPPKSPFFGSSLIYSLVEWSVNEKDSKTAGLLRKSWQ